MDLSHGGHLTHGHRANFSGKLYNVVHYGVSQETEAIDYDALEKLALEVKPQMITAGASAYSRTIDFERMGQIAKACGALPVRGHGPYRGPGGRRTASEPGSLCGLRLLHHAQIPARPARRLRDLQGGIRQEA